MRLSEGFNSRLVVLVGRRGHGKSTFLTATAGIMDIPFFSNIKIDLPKYHPLVLAELDKLPSPSLLIVDEAYGRVDSREAQALRNKVWSHIAFQLRKRSLTVIFAVQQWSSLDIRIRKETDIIVLCEFDPEEKNFTYTLYDPFDGHTDIWTLSMEQARLIFPYFNTNEIVNSELMKENDFWLYQDDKELFNRRIKEIAEIIKPNLGKVFLRTVRSALSSNKISTDWTGVVYDYLKGFLILD